MMKTNTIINLKNAPKTGFTFVMQSNRWNSPTQLRFKGWAETLDGANALLQAYVSRLKGEAGGNYKVLSRRKMLQLLKVFAANRKDELAARRAKRPKKKRANSITCPTCGASSHKLHSEMGGLQTRKCRNGHSFEYDKWIADRAFWSPATALPIIKRPVQS